MHMTFIIMFKRIIIIIRLKFLKQIINNNQEPMFLLPKSRHVVLGLPDKFKFIKSKIFIFLKAGYIFEL